MSEQRYRYEWSFFYSVEEVCKAARVQKEYHEGRRDWWEAELAKAEATLKEKGLEYRESHYTGGHRLEAVLDPQLKTRVEECRQRRDEHENKRKEFHRWERSLAHEMESRSSDLQLTIDDVEFFGL